MADVEEPGGVSSEDIRQLEQTDRQTHHAQEATTLVRQQKELLSVFPSDPQNTLDQKQKGEEQVNRWLTRKLKDGGIAMPISHS